MAFPEGAPREARASAPLSRRSHYLLGNDPHRWRRGVRQFAEVRGPDAAPGVRTLFRFRGKDPECVFEVAPGADPRAIAVELRGARGLRVGADGSLFAEVGGGVLAQSPPRAWEETAEGPRAVPVRYLRRGGARFGFQVGERDPARTLLIDPVLTFSSPLGGPGANHAQAAAFGPDGTLWIAGAAATDFPGPPGTVIGTEPGGAAIVRFDPVAREVLSTTWIGGTGWHYDEAQAIALDAEGRAFVAGATESPDFPALGGPQPAFGGDRDAFLARLSPDGSSLDWATYLGGSGYEAGTYPFGDVGLALTPDGDPVLSGTTQSADFPTRSALRGTLGGARDAFAARIRGDGSEVVFATYLGGEDLDSAGGAVSIAPDGGILLAGYTKSADFPATLLFGGARTGGFEGFAMELSPRGEEIRRTILLGPNSVDDLDFEPAGTVLLLGRTSDPEFPLPPAPHGPPSPEPDLFLLRLDRGMEDVLAGTLFGGSDDEYYLSLSLAADGTIWVAGSTGSADLPLVRPAQPLLGSSEDAFLAAFEPAGLGATFSTYLGGDARDLGNAVALAPDGATWLVGNTASTDFPSVAPLQDMLADEGHYDMFLARFVLDASGDPPRAPDALDAEALGGNEVRLRWPDLGEDETGFAIYRKETTGFSRIATVPAGTTGFTDGTVLPSRGYAYAVQAFNDAGGSGASPEAGVRTPGTLLLTVSSAASRGFNEWTQSFRSVIRGTVRRAGEDGGLPLDPVAGGWELSFEPSSPYDLNRLAIPAGDDRWRVLRHGRRLRWRRPGGYELVYWPRSGAFRLRGLWTFDQDAELRLTVGRDAGSAELEWDGWSGFVSR